jgi:hypothetical protein
VPAGKLGYKKKNTIFFVSLKSLKKGVGSGSGSVSQSCLPYRKSRFSGKKACNTRKRYNRLRSSFYVIVTANVPDPYVLGLPDPHSDLLVASTDPEFRILPFSHKSVSELK